MSCCRGIVVKSLLCFNMRKHATILQIVATSRGLLPNHVIFIAFFLKLHCTHTRFSCIFCMVCRFLHLYHNVFLSILMSLPHTRSVQKKGDFLFFSKNIYLFININFVPFKVIPLRYNTLVPVLFPILEALLICAFWYGLELF